MASGRTFPRFDRRNFRGCQLAFPRFRPVRGIARLRPYRRTAVRTEAIASSARTCPPHVMRGKRPLMAGIAVGSFCMTRRCSGLKRLLILTAIFAHWLVVLPGAHAHDDYDASPARSHHRRVEDHHRHARDHWNENIAKPIEDFRQRRRGPLQGQQRLVLSLARDRSGRAMPVDRAGRRGRRAS